MTSGPEGFRLSAADVCRLFEVSPELCGVAGPASDAVGDASTRPGAWQRADLGRLLDDAVERHGARARYIVQAVSEHLLADARARDFAAALVVEDAAADGVIIDGGPWDVTSSERLGEGAADAAAHRRLRWVAWTGYRRPPVPVDLHPLGSYAEAAARLDLDRRLRQQWRVVGWTAEGAAPWPEGWNR